MKKILITFCLLAFVNLHLSAQETAVIEIEPSDSMSISGKGAGQDAAINPFLKEGSIAIVKNIGKADVSIRVQYQGKITKQMRLGPARITRVQLPKGHELYFDGMKQKTSVEVSFRKLK